MRKIAILCLLLVGALPALAGSYRPDEIPNVQRMDRRRYVSNPDGILSAGAVARIDSLCASLRERGFALVAVVAVDDIEGGDAFSFAVELFRSWGVGSAESDNGLGILLVKELREIRFVTGGGLEGILPDALCKRIQLNYMLPAFREGDYSAGMVAGVEAAAAVLEGGEADLSGDGGELPAWMIFVIVVGFIVGPLGLVLAVMNSAELTQMWRSFIALFFMSSAIILVLAFITSFVTAMRQIQPLSEMVKATRAYAAGDFDVRMQETGDCSEISELAASFNAMADSLQETERQRRAFIANVSHELTTPMTTIAGYTDGILDGTLPPEKERQYLQIISDESRRLSRLVRRMLDISQIQNQEMKKEEFDLCESARIALLSMEQKIMIRGLDVDAEIPEDSVMVQGDRDLITQVIYNLLENAAKFAAPQSTLYLGLAVNGEKAYVTVRNQGQTIPAEEIPLLFERFHKSDKSRSEDKDGYGLGLYIVKTILTQHKEKITVTSENGVTAFTFTMQMAR